MKFHQSLKKEHLKLERMEKLISSRCNIQSVPESYILPPERRPGELIVPLCKTIPVIDLHGEFGCNRSELIQKIIMSSQEFGFFQVVNHGVSEELMRDVLIVAREFFEMPKEDKANLYSEYPKQGCRLYTSIDYAREKIHFWRDNLRHPCHPLEDHLQHWLQKPARYREVVGRYSVEVRKLSLWLLDLICDGLGLESGYFRDNLSQVQLMVLNHYPPCPDPSLTLGLPKHSDANLITLLNQEDVLGLQVLKDDQWLAVDSLPNAFVVNIGHMLQLLPSSILPRTAILNLQKHWSTNAIRPPLYRDFIYKDFVTTYKVHTHEGKPPLEHLQLLS